MFIPKMLQMYRSGQSDVFLGKNTTYSNMINVNIKDFVSQ